MFQLLSFCYPAVPVSLMFLCLFLVLPLSGLKPHLLHFLPAISCIWVHLPCSSETIQ